MSIYDTVNVPCKGCGHDLHMPPSQYRGWIIDRTWWVGWTCTRCDTPGAYWVKRLTHVRRLEKVGVRFLPLTIEPSWQ